MDSQRLLIVSPLFWPLAGSRELLATALAEELADQGHDVTVLTWRVARIWPEVFHMGDVRVVRVSRRRDRLLDSLRRMARRKPCNDELYRWMAQHQTQFDFGIVIASTDETPAIAKCFQRLQFPVVVRYEDQPTARNQIGAAESGELIRRVTGDYPRPSTESVLAVPDGIADPRSWELSRAQIRDSLQAAHPLFELRDDAILAICPCEMHVNNGLFQLIRAWRDVLKVHPTARLWLTGDGDNGYELFRQIHELEIEHAVIMPGNFDEIHDVLAAANAIIMPGTSTPADWYTRAALQLGIPLICDARNQRLQGMIQSPPQGLWLYDESENQLARVLLRWASETKSNTRSEPGRDFQINGVSADVLDPDLSLEQMARHYVTVGLAMVSRSC